MENIFAVWKPKGPTSNDILNRIRKIADTKKVGHAGTLDPLAEGILVVGIGREATKKLPEAVVKEKEYVATVKFGETSTTDDEEGEKTIHQVTAPPDKSAVEKAVDFFKGDYNQIPPAYSAIKISGKEAYKRVRSGEEVKMNPRPVEIKEIEIIEYKWPYLTIRTVTGPGTYIRSLARDIGEKLGTGAYLTKLIRTRIGGFTKEESYTIEALKERFDEKAQCGTVNK